MNSGKEINADVNKIHELMVILLDNAMKYTKIDDEIIVTTFNKDGKVCIEVSDTGIGISDEGMKYVFDRFYRDDKARNRETGGSGLGLSLAKMIVDAHGASIKVAKNEPRGTKFIVQIK